MKRSQGFSLVELMIGLTLGLILTAGVLRIFISSKQGYRVQESSSRMQENLRYALEQIGRELRHADFWGGIKPQSIQPDGTIATIGAPCSESWHADFNNGVQGFEGAASEAAVGIAACTVGTYIANSDAIVLRYADPNEVLPDDAAGMNTALFGSSSTGSALVFRSLVGRNGYLSPVAAGSGPVGTLLGLVRGIVGSDETEATGAINYRFRSTVLSLGAFTPQFDEDELPPASRRRLPTLYACSTDRRCGYGGNPEPLVEGVEQMQFEYGLDLDGNRVADLYRPASDLAAEEWARVIAVKVGLVVRGDTVDGFTDTTTYQLPGNFSYTPVDDPATTVDERTFQRRVIVRDFQIRNRIRL